MRPEARKLRYDLEKAADLILRFTKGRTLLEYSSNPMLSSAVERQFLIIGEALSQMARTDAETLERIGEHRRIVAFRYRGSAWEQVPVQVDEKIIIADERNHVQSFLGYP